MMKKIALLLFCSCGIILVGCENYNNFTSYDEQTQGCEKWVISHGSKEAKFEWNGSKKIGDKTEINGIKHEGKSKHEIKCEFNENGKLLGIKSSTLKK